MENMEKTNDGSSLREAGLKKLLEVIESSQNACYLHSGDMGDIVAGLASVKKIFELTGKRAVMLLDTSGGIETKANSKLSDLMKVSTMGKGLKFNRKSFDFLYPLLMAQPYIEDVVEYSESDESRITINLNVFRKFSAMREVNKRLYSNLMYCQQLACFLLPGYKGPWLTLPPGVSESVRLPVNSEGRPRDIAVSRSNRYHSCQIFHSSMAALYEDRGFFIGTELEYMSFVDCTRIDPEKFPLVKVESALDIAAIQTRCHSIVSNGTLAYWIAVGQGRKVVHELAGSEILFSTYMPEYSDCLFIHDDNAVFFDFEKMVRIEKPLNEVSKDLEKATVGSESWDAGKKEDKEEEGVVDNREGVGKDVHDI